MSRFEIKLLHNNNRFYMKLLTLRQSFEKEIGLINNANQYVELAKRAYESKERDIQKDSSSFGLRVSILSDRNITELSYIVNVHSAFERGLYELYNCHYFTKAAEKTDDKSILQFFYDKCLKGKKDSEIKALYSICEYYRIVRNYFVHGENHSKSDIKNAFCNAKNSANSNLLESISGRLNAPNEYGNICFDDQVLFSRCAIRLFKKLFESLVFDLPKYIQDNLVDLRKRYGRYSKNKKRIKKSLLHELEIQKLHFHQSDYGALDKEIDIILDGC